MENIYQAGLQFIRWGARWVIHVHVANLGYVERGRRNANGVAVCVTDRERGPVVQVQATGPGRGPPWSRQRAGLLARRQVKLSDGDLVVGGDGDARAAILGDDSSAQNHLVRARSVVKQVDLEGVASVKAAVKEGGLGGIVQPADDEALAGGQSECHDDALVVVVMASLVNRYILRLVRCGFRQTRYKVSLDMLRCWKDSGYSRRGGSEEG